LGGAPARAASSAQVGLGRGPVVVEVDAHQGGDVADGRARLGGLDQLGEGGGIVPRGVAEHRLGGRPGAAERDPGHPAVVGAGRQGGAERHRHARAGDDLAPALLDHHRLAGAAVDVEHVPGAAALDP
jgi:hypothetical protein